ncbi:MAG: hypothetical protein CFE45_09435, partial [Burkholderiales bacterium PBB5]
MPKSTTCRVRTTTGRALHLSALTMALAAAGLSGCSLFGDDAVEVSVKPSEVGAVTTTRYDGLSDDLLTAGYGKAGLQTGTAGSAVPAAADPANPTA